MIGTGLLIVISIVGLLVLAVLSLFFTRAKEWIIRNAKSRKNVASSVSGNLVREVYGPISDNYKLSKTMLGKGASAECYVGVDVNSKREYAIKCVDTRDEKILRFYEREIQILKDLEHLNIVRLYEVYHGQNSLHFVMELCLGGHLGEALATRPNGRFDEPVAQAYIAQLVGALAHCHAHGICHRDIKLQNILLESRARDAQIKLIDFGNSKRFNLPTAAAASPSNETVFTRMAGTTYTMAPEVFRGEYDERCDIWSVGVVCFILLSGERPFESLDMPNQPEAAKSSLVSNILMGRYSFRSDAWQDIDDESLRFTQLCLTMDYRKRPSAAQLLKMSWCSPDTATRTFLTERATRTLTRRLSRATSTGLNRTSMLAVAFTMPATKARELRSLFQQIDVDRSGQVDRTEFRTALHVTEPNMTDADVDALFDAIDQDGNQEISFLEFVAAMVDPREVDINEINQAFKLLDQEGKGYITHQDIYKLLATSFDSQEVTSNARRLSFIENLRRSSFGSSMEEPSAEALHVSYTSASHISSCYSQESDAARNDRMRRIQTKVSSIIEQADINGDGKISYAEFVLCMSGETGSAGEIKDNNKSRIPCDNNSGEGNSFVAKGVFKDGYRLSTVRGVLASVFGPAQISPVGSTSRPMSRAEMLV